MLARIEAAFTERKASEDRLRRFVADASHELRTPLTSIRGYAELFRRGADRRPEDLAKSMQRIEDEATRMGVLVDDLLLLARLDQGRPLEREPVDLATVVGQAVDAAHAVEPDRPLSLAVDAPVTVVGDRRRLRQVVDNLLANVRTPPRPSGCSNASTGLTRPALVTTAAWDSVCRSSPPSPTPTVDGSASRRATAGEPPSRSSCLDTAQMAWTSPPTEGQPARQLLGAVRLAPSWLPGAADTLSPWSWSNSCGILSWLPD